jgi:hypothetical protein
MFLLLLLLVYAAMTQAVYYIDDRNSIITYSGGKSWGPDFDNGALDQTLWVHNPYIPYIPLIGSFRTGESVITSRTEEALD